jgi:hypothetical protein
MSVWSKLAAWGAAIPTGGASLALESQADNLKSQRQAWNPNTDYLSGMPTAPTDVMNGVNLDRSGLNAFAGEAMRTGPSAWSKLATQQQDQSQADALQRGTAQTAATTQGAQDQMAMQGGLTSGAAERVAQSGARNMLDMGQDIARQGDQNRLQVSINDEQNRISQLGQLPGMQLAASGFDLSKANAQNAFNAQNYQTQGGIIAAGKQADLMDPRNPQSPNYDDGKRWYNPFSWTQ